MLSIIKKPQKTREDDMNRMNKMILICTAVLAAAFLAGFDRQLSAAAAPPEREKSSEKKVEAYPVKTVLRELFSVDPEKRDRKSVV